jgi:hypothetical protein
MSRLCPLLGLIYYQYYLYPPKAMSLLGEKKGKEGMIKKNVIDVATREKI